VYAVSIKNKIGFGVALLYVYHSIPSTYMCHRRGGHQPSVGGSCYDAEEFMPLEQRSSAPREQRSSLPSYAVVARAPVAGAPPTAAPAREGRAGGAEEGRTSWRGASGIARV
jgi:hypothetical protein